MAVNRYASIRTIEWILRRDFKSGSRNVLTDEEKAEYQELLQDKRKRLKDRVKVTHKCYVDQSTLSTEIYTTGSESINLTFRTAQLRPAKKSKQLIPYTKMIDNWWEKYVLPWTCPHCKLTITQEMIPGEVLVHRLRR